MITTFIVILAVLALFIWERFPMDLIAILGMIALVLFGVLTPEQALGSFSNYAIVTIGAMFIVAAGLSNTGALTVLSNGLSRIGGRSHTALVLVLLLGPALLSMFMANTPVILVFIPITLAIAAETRTSPSKLLLLIPYGAILGGSCTLIGTSPNLLVADLWSGYSSRAAEPWAEVGMFTFSPFGLVQLAILTPIIVILSRRLLPERTSLMAASRDSKREYLTETTIGAKSPYSGKRLDDTPFWNAQGCTPLSVVRGDHAAPVQPHWVLRPGDTILVAGDANALVNLYRRTRQRSLTEAELTAEQEIVLAEIVVTPGSRLVGRTPRAIQFHQRWAVTLFALMRGDFHVRDRLSDMPLRAGDVLLVQGTRKALHNLRSSRSFMVIEGVHRLIQNREKATTAMAITTAVVALISTGAISPAVAALAGAAAMVLFGVLSTGEAYESIHWNVIALLAGTMALGTALRVTGGAEFLANSMVVFAQDTLGLGPQGVFSATLLVAMVMANLIGNSAALLLMAPIAFGISQRLGVSGQLFLMGAAMAAEAAFATPVYQGTAMIYGAGGYRFRDFLRFGVPICLAAWAVQSFFLPIFWPL